MLTPSHRWIESFEINPNSANSHQALHVNRSNLQADYGTVIVLKGFIIHV